jgi:hypothetical protein
MTVFGNDRTRGPTIMEAILADESTKWGDVRTAPVTFTAQQLQSAAKTYEAVARLASAGCDLTIYGNSRLLEHPERLWSPHCEGMLMTEGAGEKAPSRLKHLGQRYGDVAEVVTEAEVLNQKVLVCAVCNDLWQRAALVPLRWGAPRAIVLTGGLKACMGDDLRDELFRAARLWRYEFDPSTDLVVSYSRHLHAKPLTGPTAYPKTCERLVRALSGCEVAK